LASGDKPDIAAEKAFAMFFENKARFYNSANDTFRKLNILLQYFNKTLSLITDDDVIRFIKDYQSKNRTNGTINRYLFVLSAVCHYADERGYNIPQIKFSRYKLKEKAENIKYLPDWNAAQKVIDAAPEHLKPIIYTALYTGMRLGNILNLKWENIDFINKTINLTVKDRTKEGGKNLSVPMIEKLENILNSLPKCSDYVFTYKGRRIGKIETAWHNTFYKPHTKELKNPELKYFNFHTLRHTAGTWILKQTGNLKITQQILGHSDITTTTKYAHVLDEQKRNALEDVFK
jgi:integrase